MACKALSPQEIESVIESLTNTRDKLFFILSYRTGFRVSELLSLKISDIIRNNEVVAEVRVSKKSMKGKIKSRTVPLHAECRQAISAHLTSLWRVCPDDYLFAHLQDLKRPMSRFGVLKALKAAFERAGIVADGSYSIGTHCGRKTLAKKVYEQSGHDLILTQRVLGHVSIMSTVAYLSTSTDKVNAAILA